MRPSPSSRSSTGCGRCVGDARQVEGDGHHAGRREPQAFQFLAVELGVAKGQVDMPHQAGQILTPERGDSKDLRVIGRKEVRRRDVVVLQHAPGRQLLEGRRHRRRQA